MGNVKPGIRFFAVKNVLNLWQVGENVLVLGCRINAPGERTERFILQESFRVGQREKKLEILKKSWL